MESQLILAAQAVIPALSEADVRLAVDTKPDDATRVIFEFNKNALAQAMRARGFTSVVVTCSNEVAFQPTVVGEGLEPIVVARMRYRWDEELACGGSELVFADMRLRDVAEALRNTAIELTGHTDGGNGTFTLQAIDATPELEHSDFYTESYTTAHAL